jgi:hypothetical protein
VADGNPYYTAYELGKIAAVYQWMQDPNRPPLPEEGPARDEFFLSRAPENVEDVFPGGKYVTPAHVEAIWGGRNPFVGDLERIVDKAWWQTALSPVIAAADFSAKHREEAGAHTASRIRGTPDYNREYWAEIARLDAMDAEGVHGAAMGTGYDILRAQTEAETRREDLQGGYLFPRVKIGGDEVAALAQAEAKEEFRLRREAFPRKIQAALESQAPRPQTTPEIATGGDTPTRAEGELSTEAHPGKIYRRDPWTGEPVR